VSFAKPLIWNPRPWWWLVTKPFVNLRVTLSIWIFFGYVSWWLCRGPIVLILATNGANFFRFLFWATIKPSAITQFFWLFFFGLYKSLSSIIPHHRLPFSRFVLGCFLLPGIKVTIFGHELVLLRLQVCLDLLGRGIGMDFVVIALGFSLPFESYISTQW